MAQFRFNTISRIDIENSPGGALMIYAIDYEDPQNLIISGVPGSGKTTVNLMRAERLVNLGRHILFFTYQELLVLSLRNSSTAELAPHIYGFFKWFADNTNGKWVSRLSEAEMIAAIAHLRRNYDEVVVDEGQDLQLKAIRAIFTLGKKLTVSGDDAQRLNTSGVTVAEIKTQLRQIGEMTPVELQYNYRNTYEIYNFARFFLPRSTRANNQLALNRLPRGRGDLPNVIVVKTEDERKSRLRILLSNAGERNIAILVFSPDEVDHYAAMITKLGFTCSKHHSNSRIGGDDNMENILVTTLMSAKGVEFQVVIMPNFEQARSGRLEHYYVGSTRPRESFSIIALGNLPTFFRDFEQGSYNLIT